MIWHDRPSLRHTLWIYAQLCMIIYPYIYIYILMHIDIYTHACPRVTQLASRCSSHIHVEHQRYFFLCIVDTCIPFWMFSAKVWKHAYKINISKHVCFNFKVIALFIFFVWILIHHLFVLCESYVLTTSRLNRRAFAICGAMKTSAWKYRLLFQNFTNNNISFKCLLSCR